jgi:hypothetical protein
MLDILTMALDVGFGVYFILVWETISLSDQGSMLSV